MMELTIKEKAVLEKMVEEYFLKNWNICDKYGDGTPEYKSATEECDNLKCLSRKFRLSLPEYIYARF